MITREQAKSIITLSGLSHRAFARECNLSRNVVYHLVKHDNISNKNLELIESYAVQNSLLPAQTEALNSAMLKAIAVPTNDEPLTLGDMAAVMLAIVLAAVTLMLFLV